MTELAGHPGIPNTPSGVARVLKAEREAAVVGADGCGHVPGTACDVRRFTTWPHGFCVTHARAVVNTDPADGHGPWTATGPLYRMPPLSA